MSERSEGAKHFDDGKPPLQFLPTEPLFDVAHVFAYGARKYGLYNWKGGLRYTRLIGSTLRHIYSWLACEERDPESGLKHLAHAVADLLMVMDLQKLRPDLDDRWREHGDGK